MQRREGGGENTLKKRGERTTWKRERQGRREQPREERGCGGKNNVEKRGGENKVEKRRGENNVEKRGGGVETRGGERGLTTALTVQNLSIHELN